MTVELLTPSAEPVVDDGTYAGYAAIARKLSLQHPDRPRPYSRQLVERWYKRRYYNGFPEGRQVVTRTGRVRTMFKMSEVEAWHRSYRLHHKMRADDASDNVIDTIPLFYLNEEGIPIF